ncbi:serine/threonine-protein kinase [Pseudonocardia lacus]|uniref:serine/threonine-protein kinase n=1 Tax=Pseudonocardia lacus TaxID=2835865 RepID=UPI001BDC5FC5|nr:serine/threonine-protein kinase [Pseudonocardia lacus]
MDPLLPDDPDRVGPHTLLARLGAGGMGQVYLARSRAGRPVAVKVVHENLAADREFRARFGREVAAARRVTGAYTAPLLDADPDAATPWLATAYLPGLPLDDAVARHGPLPAAAVRALGAALAEALGAIHAAGVVHRDLKPANVLLTSTGPRVIDFGIARAADFATLTGTGVVIGTPGYLAPEQITGADAGAPADVFALGALLVHALTGVGPFGRGSSHELLMRSVSGAPVLDAVADPALLAELAACLDKDPARRPATSELVAAWSSDAVATTGEALDGTRWLPDPIADEIDRAAAELPRLMAAPRRVAAPPDPVSDMLSALPTQPLTPPRPERRTLSRRALLGGVAGAAVLGTVGFVLLRDRAPGTSGPVRWLLPSQQAWLASGPWLLDGVLLAEDTEGNLESRSTADGSRRWSSNVRISSGAALNAVDGVCVGFPGALADDVVAIDLAGGAPLWNAEIETLTAYPAAPVGGAGRVVLVGREDGGPAAVHAFGARDGARLWRTELGGTRAYGVAVDGDAAYSADDAGYAYGVDVASGVARWRTRVTEKVGEGAYSRPVTAGGRVYLADRDTLFALDGRTGQPVWSRPIDEGIGESTTPLLADDRVYLSAVDDTLYALGAADGAVVWKAAAGSGGPVFAGRVVGTSTAAEVLGIDIDSGRTLWSRPVNTDSGTWPVLAGGLFHVADDDGVVSLEPSSGTVVRAVGEADGVRGAENLDTDGSALYLAVYNDGPALCSLSLPGPPAG